MNIILGLPDTKIVEKIALRRTLNKKVDVVKLDDRTSCFNSFLENYVKDNGLSQALLASQDSKESLALLIGDFYTYIESDDCKVKVAALNVEAEAILTSNITAERWKPVVCDCVLHRISDDNLKYTKDSVQLFLFKSCPEHTGLSKEELHETIDRESKAVSFVLRTLLGFETVKDLGLEETKIEPNGNESIVFKSGIKLEMRFNGLGKDRKLITTLTGASILDIKRQEIQESLDLKLGGGKAEVL